MTFSNRDKVWLAHFAAGNLETPYGMGPVWVTNYVSQRKWLMRIEREVDFGPERYRLTPEGLRAYEQSRISN